MRHNMNSNKERGVVLILILAFMTMFAIMIAAFLIMTSNMSDSAVNSLIYYERRESVADRKDEDLDTALKTLVTGTNNPNSPIGPFSLLENLYGDITYSNGIDPLSFDVHKMFANYMEDGVTLKDIAIEFARFTNDGLDNEGNPKTVDRERDILNAGDIVTFGPPENASAAFDPFSLFYDLNLRNATARVTGREFFTDANGLDIARLRLQPTPELAALFTASGGTVQYDERNPVFSTDPNLTNPFLLSIRLESPPFSGTGAGDFAPNGHLDGQTNPDDSQNTFRLPFALWGNAAAPDMTPYRDQDDNINFRTFLQHISNRNYSVFGYNSEMKSIPDFTDGAWNAVVDRDGNGNMNQREPVRMNSSYVAADGRNLFLSRYQLRGNGASSKTKVTPSFVRPDSIQSFLNFVSHVIQFNHLASQEDEKINPKVDWLSVLRKMTPRPLPMDHWNFTGGNSALLGMNAAIKENLKNTTDKEYYYQQVNQEWVPEFASSLLDDAVTNPWDVDNDNDGVKDGIWFPSGLPIRTDENGTPYATMYSYTVVDLDGRVNVNTAGNRDQLWNDYGVEIVESGPKNVYTSLEPLAKKARSNDPASPWFVFENLDGGLGWMSDVDKTLTNIFGMRGTGLGPASVHLHSALTAMDLPNGGDQVGSPGIRAGNLLYQRYYSPRFATLSGVSNWSDPTFLNQIANDPFLDGQDGMANAMQSGFRWNLPQPSSYVDLTGNFNEPDNFTVDDSDNHRRFFLYTDAIYRGERSDTVADPNLFIFPWRGKTRVADYGVTNASSRYPLSCDHYPTFDFGDTALRSYDPLGNDILTYMPKYGENPYLVDPYGVTIKDSTFNTQMLEKLLRPFDYDVKTGQTNLLETLLKTTAGNSVNETERKNLIKDYLSKVSDPNDPYRALRQDITTISSNIPAPAMAFPTGPSEEPDGVFGIRELIYHCVLLELYQANKETLFDDAFITATKETYAGDHFGDVDAVLPDDESTQRAVRQFIREQIKARLEDHFGDKIKRLTDQLYALLPEEIQAGRRLDLNALSHKASWLDAVYDMNDADNNPSTLVLTDKTNVDALSLSDADKDALKEKIENAHTLGLIERMKFARGLYVLLMTLSYRDRNAKTVADFYNPDGSLDNVKANEEEAIYADKYSDYLEGFDQNYIQSLDEEDRDDRDAELVAHRLAQYCVNVVDFSDPDATMTPFFYDPNPFQGWWVMNNDWMTKQETVLYQILTTPKSNPNDANTDFYDSLQTYFQTPDANAETFLDVVNSEVKNATDEDVPFIEENDSYAQAIVSWLSGQAVNTAGVGEEDFGFRQVWGMERPDLLLTETLNFHDLGIADTKNEKANGSGDEVSDDDTDFDQVRRPLGSTYLELYCAANPNIPQSPELYEFDTTRNLWKLDLSKMTPEQKNSPYNGHEFPIWRVAISASVDPRGNEEKEEKLTDSENNEYKRTIRKEANSVIERLLGSNADFRTFSLQTRQFCDLTPGSSKSLDNKLDSKWRGYDYCVSNILGPTFVEKEGNPDLSKEIELDRIVWFGWPTLSDGTRDSIDNFPDSSHIYSRVKEKENDSLKTFLFPNQYLVVGPSKSRSLGSIYKNLTDGNYFGVPAKAKLSFTGLGVMDEETESNAFARAGTLFMRAGTYKGLDVNTVDGFEFNKRGLNISEPLWASATDPYPTTIPTKDVKIDGVTVTVTDTERNAVPDKPFDLPDNETGHNKDHFPIAADRLFGLGTVPGYRSAFVQRVADPNRPYHPSANPYLTVDWNMMDLTVFNGEAADSGYTQSSDPFWRKDDAKEARYPDLVNEENQILLDKSIFMTDKGKTLELETDSEGTSSLFSSRGWLNPNQKGFFPADLQSNHRPNPWARPIDKNALRKDDKAGLEKNVSLKDFDSTVEDRDVENSVVKIAPSQSIGRYNGKDRVTATSTLFGSVANATDRENLRKLYYGAPAQEGSTTEFQPFEHLIWNDAPLDSPAELLFVPASIPGRFGLEFIRNKDVTDGSFSLVSLYSDGEMIDSRQMGRSLGSGYKEEAKDKNLFGWPIDSQLTGPYLNFHHSSLTLGESLNLGKIFEFAAIPSLYVGTKTFSGFDENGDPIYAPTMREPGKMNINTLRKPGWNGIIGGDGDDAPVTSFETFSNSRRLWNQENFVPFQPAHTEPLKVAFPDQNDIKKIPSGDLTLLTANIQKWSENSTLEGVLDNTVAKNNFYTATEELRKLSSLTTNRSNVFAVWMTVGYFKVEKAQPGVNMPLYDPDGNLLPTTNQTADPDGKAYLNLVPGDKYYDYYRVIYPDGYTYGKELGTEGIDEGGVTRPRAFYLIDRSIPVDFRRGRSWNWDKTILLERKL